MAVIITADMSFGTQLKELYLIRCTGIQHLGNHFRHNNNLSKIKIFDSGDFDWRLFECIQKEELLSLELKGVTNSKNEVINLDKLLCNMPRINTLLLDGCLLKSFKPGASGLERLIPTLKKLFLECIGLYDVVHTESILCLIRSLPQLQCLFIRLEPQVNNNSDSDLLNSMVLPVDLILDQLKAVKILGMVGSRVEFQFIKLFLASTPSLRWIKLKKRITVGRREELRILQDLLQIPRASTSSQIIWT